MCSIYEGVYGVDRLQSSFKLEFHDADTDTYTDILARILTDTSDTRDFLKLFLWQAERHADILATILARMSTRLSVSVSVSVSALWNASFIASTVEFGHVGRCELAISRPLQ